MQRILRLRTLLYLFVLGFQLPLWAHAQSTMGIHFFEGSWKELLATAQRLNKPIFVDVYTDWCGPCKRMEKEVFIRPAVGRFYNDHFLCYRLNPEKGDGVTIAAPFAIKVYPSFLFLDSKGYLLTRDVDFRSAEEFIAIGKGAATFIGLAGNLSDMAARFQQGDRQPSFLQDYLEKRTSLKLDNTEVLNAYVMAVPREQLQQPAAIQFLLKHSGSSNSDAVPVILDGISTMHGTAQQDAASILFGNLLYYAAGHAIKENHKTEADTLMSYIDRVRPFLKEKELATADNLALHYHAAIGNAEGLKAVGYRIANQIMSTDIKVLRAQDSAFFVQVMAPFLTGKEDSTKIPDFQSEKKMAAARFSNDAATRLYTVADLFHHTLAPGDPALKDALAWTEHALILYPNDAIRKLSERLRSSVSAAGDRN